MPKFTLILEFRGGTYIRQVRARAPRSALNLLSAGSDGKRKIFEALLDDDPVAIEGIPNCWCCSVRTKGDWR